MAVGQLLRRCIGSVSVSAAPIAKWFVPGEGFAGRSRSLVVDLEVEDAEGLDHVSVTGQRSSMQNV
jgi:hypothetical protein